MWWPYKLWILNICAYSNKPFYKGPRDYRVPVWNLPDINLQVQKNNYSNLTSSSFDGLSNNLCRPLKKLMMHQHEMSRKQLWHKANIMTPTITQPIDEVPNVSRLSHTDAIQTARQNFPSYDNQFLSTLLKNNGSTIASSKTPWCHYLKGVTKPWP